MQSAWTKRLNDLRQLIAATSATYFEPERFRLNLNQAIQTARTVTFLIQKNKARIPDFERLHKEYIADAMGNDTIMKWLVQSRNTIEKEGDLATFSQMRAEIVFSYTEDGPSVDARDEALLFCGTRALQRFWAKRVPAWIADDSVIMIERRWVADSLPQHELTDVLIHGFHQLKKAADAMDGAAGYVDRTNPTTPVRELGSAMRRTFIKLSDGIEYGLEIQKMLARTDERDAIVARYGGFDGRFLERDLSLPERVEAWADFATKIFNKDGYHITMYVLLKPDGGILATGVVEFADRVDKFLFWRQLAEFAKSDPELYGIVFVGEAWIRTGYTADFEGDITALPIVGEKLCFYGACAPGDYYELSFDINRSTEKATVDRNSPSPPEGTEPNVLAPLRRAWAATNPR